MSQRRSEVGPRRNVATAAPTGSGLSPVVLLCALAALLATAAALPGLFDLAEFEAWVTAEALLLDADRSGRPVLNLTVDASAALLSAAATVLAAGLALDLIGRRR